MFDASHTAKVPTTKAMKGIYGSSATETEEFKMKEYTKRYTFREGSFVPLVFDIYGAWGRSTTKYLNEEKKKRKLQGKPSVWGKVKVAISIGACRAFTRRLDSAREWIAPQNRGKKAPKSGDQAIKIGESDEPDGNTQSQN